MLVQVIDVDYILRDNSAVVRIFGKRDDGRAVCVFVDDFQPYFYAEIRPGVDEQLGMLKLKYEEIALRPAIGWHQESVKFFKVIVPIPQDVPRIRAVLEQYTRCYEADILFKYRFMVDNGLRGMMWIDVDGDPVKTASSKVCSVRAKTIKSVEKKENMQLRYLSVDIECLQTDYKRALDASRDPMIAIAMAFLPSFGSDNSLVLVAKPISGLRGAMGFDSEKAMLESFLSIVEKYDPDVVTGFNINGFDIPYILTRLKKFNLPQDFGRSDKAVWSRPVGTTQEANITGRVVADVYQIVKRDPNVRFVRYNLATVAKEIIGEEKGDVKHTEMQKVWASEVPRLVEYARKDAVLALRLIVEKRMLDRFIELSKLSGVLLQDCLGGQSQRIETMLLHEFYKRGMVMPPKPVQSEAEKRLEEKIKGAIVLEPKKGLHYDSVLVLDFQSLYPNIIRTFNVSPDTILLGNIISDVSSHVAPNGAKFVDKNVYEGVLPTVVKSLLEARKATKRAMKATSDETEKRILDAQQYALKILSNSMYGYCGYARARLFVAEVANAITAYGRENILKTKELVEKAYGNEVIYSDTDSLFIKVNESDLDKAWVIGENASKLVSEKMSLQMEFEKVYKTFLILTKKRYAGLKVEKTASGWRELIDMRGIETVRRDWCPLVGKTLFDVLQILLKDRNPVAAKARVKEVIERLASGKIPMEDLTIVKGITRSLDTYKGLQPHIELARKMQKRDPSGGPKVGDRLGFVIIKGRELLSKRAEDPEYAQKYNLSIDVDYYITTQVMPPITRVFDAIGVDYVDLVSTGRQTSLFDVQMSGIVCRDCGQAHRRLPITGKCSCGQVLVMAV